MKNNLVLVIAPLICVSVFAAGDPYMSNDVAVHVNNQNISTLEVEVAFMDSYSLLQDKIRRGEVSKADLPDAIRAAWAEALDTTIQDRILDQRADAHRREIVEMILRRAGGPMSGDKALEMFRRLEADAIEHLRKDMLAASGGEEELRKALKKRGQTIEQWDSNLRRELFRREVIGLESGPVIPGGEREVREYYTKHLDQFGQPEAWRLRRFRLNKKRFSNPEIAYQAILKVKQRIENGGDFAEVTASLSDDKEFAEGGGLMKRNGKTDLPSGNFPEEEQIASKLKDNEISQPIDAGEWYVLIQRLGHQEARVQRFEEASERAEGLAYMEKLKAAKRKMYDRLKSKAYIEIIRKDPPEHLLNLKD